MGNEPCQFTVTHFRRSSLAKLCRLDPQTDQLWEGELVDQSHHSGTHPERTIGLSGTCTCLPRWEVSTNSLARSHPLL